MPTESRAISPHNLPGLSRSPFMPSHDGSAAAAAAQKSAALSPASEAFYIKASPFASSSSYLLKDDSL